MRCCPQCGKYYTLDPKTRKIPEEVRQQAIKTYYAGASGRGVGKVFGFSKVNVYNWIKKTDELPEKEHTLEIDELYHFVERKGTSETRENTHVIAMAATLMRANYPFRYWILFNLRVVSIPLIYKLFTFPICIPYNPLLSYPCHKNKEEKKMKKSIILVLALSLLVVPALASAAEITVISREDGSGTRGAFIELLGVQVRNDAGQNMDMTTDEAIITNSTSVMLAGVASDPNAIGYVSLGSLNDTVKALAVDGAAATTDAIKSGEYKISRPFNIAVGDNVSEAAQDFIGFILSAEGQAVVEASGYIAVADDAPAYAGSASGKVVVAGSSSVTPVMERLKEAYVALNPEVNLEIQQSDSSIGMQAAIDGICDIGMASRALRESELEKLTATVIAIDGIAVIVNLDNPVDSVEKDSVRAIFVGEITDWADVQ